MRHVSENELLSAYLDGELTAAEHAKVKQLLAESPAARQTLDELRALSAALQSLPECRLGEDLSHHVLRRAERAILSRPGTLAPQAASARSAWPWREWARRMIASRGVAWSAAALAIALLIMLSGAPEHDRDVALAPKPAEHKPRIVVEAEMPDDAELWAPGADRTPEVAPRADVAAMPAAELHAEASDIAADTAADIAAPAEEEVAMPAAPQAVRAAPEPPKVARSLPLAAPAEPEGFLRSDQEQAGSFGVIPRLESERDAKALPGTAGDLPVLLVNCDITPEAARHRVLDQVLADQQIAVHPEGRSRPAREEPMAQRQSARDFAGARRERTSDERLPATLGQAEVPDGAFDVVYMEATPAQVAATLDQLAQSPEQFLAVSVEPAPGVASQQSLTRFNRRGQQVAGDMDDVVGPLQDELREADQPGVSLFEHARAPSDAERTVVPAERYRVLFVLRVVPPEQPDTPAGPNPNGPANDPAAAELNGDG